MKLAYIQPHTKEWYAARIGVFTSSECVRLLKGGTRQMTQAELEAKKAQDKIDKAAGRETNSRKTVDTLFGAGALTYINEKATEIINKQAKETPVTKVMQRGLDLEPEALEYYEKATGRRMETCGLYKINSYTGGTPDGIYGKRKIVGIAEIKCLNADNHGEIFGFSDINSIAVEQLRNYDESFYAQSQMNMYVTGAKWCDFISYDNRPMGYRDNGELDEDNYDPEKWIFCIKIIRIKRDETFIADLISRLDAAVGLLVKELQRRMKSADKNRKRFERLNKAA